MKNLKFYIVCTYLLYLPWFCVGQATSCANAIASPAIPLSSALTSNTVCSNTAFNLTAAFAGPVGSCVGATRPTCGWFSFVAACTSATVSVTGGSRNIALVVWAADCATPIQIACNNINSTSASVAFATSVGTQYLIEIVRTVGGGGAATGNICVTHPPLPAFTNNGDCTSLTNSDLVGCPDFSSYPASWTNVPYTDPICEGTSSFQDTPDLVNATSPSFVDFNAIPQSGSTCVAGLHAGIVSNRWQEGIQKSVSGFTPGSIYSITFYQCVIKQASAPDPTGSWILYADNTLIGVSAISTSSLAVGNVNVVWEQRTLNFTATAATHVLKFLPQDNDVNLTLFAAGEAAGVRMGLDNISISCSIILPIEMTDFSGIRNGKFADIFWRTESEINNDYFILERSIDGLNWDYVTKIPGAGNSSNPLQYNYQDENSFSVVSYYRLIQVDFDGTISNSNIIDIDKLGQNNMILTFPNPSSDLINIKCNKKSLMNSTIQIWDVAGKLVFSEEISKEIYQTSIRIEDFSKGMYFIQILNSEIISRDVFIKN